MARISSFLALSLALAAASDLATGAKTATPATATPTSVPGGWSSAEVTTEATDLLAKAMTANGEKGYASAAGSARVCYSQVLSLETQVVAGTNYRFHVSGCAVGSAKKAGKCSSEAKKGCKAKKYAVTVFEQTWTSTLQVTSIKAEGSSLHVSIKGADA